MKCIVSQISKNVEDSFFLTTTKKFKESMYGLTMKICFGPHLYPIINHCYRDSNYIFFNFIFLSRSDLGFNGLNCFVKLQFITVLNLVK